MRTIAGILRGLVLTAVIAGPPCVLADEAWLQRAPLPPGTRPLLALVVDNSAALAGSVTVRPPYDPATDYAAGVPEETRCDPARVYWRRGAGPAPDCGRMPGLEATPATPDPGLHCAAASGPLARHGVFVAARTAQWQDAAAGGYWASPAPTSVLALRCSADGASDIDWNRPPLGDPYIFYTGNYLNWLQSEAAPVEQPFADTLLQALTTALDASGELEVAAVLLSQATPGAAGAYVALAPAAAATAAQRLAELLTAESAGGPAWLSTALLETSAWLAGSTVRFGTDARADPAAFADQAAGEYRSPIVPACRPVSIAVLAAGTPAQDAPTTLAANALPGFAAATGGCDSDCLPALSAWLADTDLIAALPGQQHAPVTWLATPATAAAVAPAAAATSGLVHDLTDPLALINLVARSLGHDAAVPAGPQLSAAGLVPAGMGEAAPEIVYGLTLPLGRERWPGNALAYGLSWNGPGFAGPTVVDRDGETALDAATSLPRSGSRSLWSETEDTDWLSGGAAGRLPAAAARRLFSNLTTAPMTDPANRLTPDNELLGRDLLGLGTHDQESPAEVINWLRALRQLGDPGPAAPIVLRLDADDGLVLVATQDGLLHAFDLATGVERWAFLPRELLTRLAGLQRDEPTTLRSHGLDGPMLLHEHDPDHDGTIDPAAGEHRWLILGLGRGGSGYYALDLALPAEPRLLWTFDPSSGAAESRPEAVVTRLSIADSGQSAGNWVVLLAGGYDRRFNLPVESTAGAGNRLSVVDATNGHLLWQAGSEDDTDVTLGVAGFTSSLAAAPRALDLDGDGRLDRLYQLDITGSLWRFDFASGAAAGQLARARRIARLGAGAQRFFATPDASLTRLEGTLRVTLAVGSGWLSRPRDTSAVDRAYVLFDREPPGSTRVLADSDLHDATAAEGPMPTGAPGWFLRLARHGSGEKVIGPTLTFDRALWLRTYQPLPFSPDAPCGPPPAIRRLYALDPATGLPVVRTARDFEEPRELIGSGLPPALRFGESRGADAPPRYFGIAGAEVFDAGWSNAPVKTSWRRLRPPADSR